MSYHEIFFGLLKKMPQATNEKLRAEEETTIVSNEIDIFLSLLIINDPNDLSLREFLSLFCCPKTSLSSSTAQPAGGGTGLSQRIQVEIILREASLITEKASHPLGRR